MDLKKNDTDIFFRKDRLPLFPVEMVTYPGELIKVQISDTRYWELIRFCEENEVGFGILPVIGKRLFAYGCAVKLLFVNRNFAENTFEVTLIGTKVFYLNKFLSDDDFHLSYPFGDVRFLKDHSRKESSLFVKKKVEKTFLEINEVLLEKGGCDFFPKDEKNLDEENLSKDLIDKKEVNSYFMASRMLGLSLNERAMLLTFRSESKRLEFLHRQMKKLLSILKRVFDE